jgi:hypothetical protein
MNLAKYLKDLIISLSGNNIGSLVAVLRLQIPAQYTSFTRVAD